MGIINSIKTLYYGLIMRVKLGFYTRKKRRHKKFAQKILIERLSKIKLKDKTLERITENYLNIGEIFLDRKNLKAAFSFHRLTTRRKNNTNS
jgi:hypothetical protein